ncbi:hypothetical protein TNCV_4789561 [Trichonephila clavipes]|nr:hypothetical protein TNCV_4789561 [Trichonephila clavipes]
MIKIKGGGSDEIERKRKLQNKVRCQRYRDKRKRDITVNSRISQHQAITIEEEIIIKRLKEQDKQKSKRYRDQKRAYNLINLQTDKPSKTVEKHVPERQNFHTSQIPGPSTRNVPYIPPTHTPNAAGPSIRNELYIPISYLDYNADIQTDTPLQVNYVPQLDEPIMEGRKEGLITSNYECSKRNERMGLYTNERVLFWMDLNRDFECACLTIASQNINGGAPTVVRLAMRSSGLFFKSAVKLYPPLEKDQQFTLRIHLVPLYLLAAIVCFAWRHLVLAWRFFGLSPTVWALLGFYQQNSSAHREFQKDFLEKDFGHVCGICDRQW